MKHLFLIIVALIALQTIAEDTPPPSEYVCYRTSDDRMKIDGAISDEEWSAAAWASEFVDIVGHASSPKPQFKTQVKLLWSDTHLYLAAHLDETNIVGTLTKHDDSLYSENAFELFIDPDGDNHNYCEFEMNALNTVMDLLMSKPYRDRGNADLDFELSRMKTAVHLDGTLNQPGDTDRGWDIEIAIPFTALKPMGVSTAPRDGNQWRMNFARAEYTAPKEAHYSVWSPHGVMNMHTPEHFGYVQFSTAPAGTAKFTPDLTAPARATLMNVYRSEQTFRRKNKRWATLLTEMNFDSQGVAIDIKQTGDGWTASTPAANDPAKHVVHVQQDSRLWVTDH